MNSFIGLLRCSRGFYITYVISDRLEKTSIKRTCDFQFSRARGPALAFTYFIHRQQQQQQHRSFGGEGLSNVTRDRAMTAALGEFAHLYFGRALKNPGKTRRAVGSA